MFVQRFNPVRGQSEWQFQHEDYDYCQEVARSSYADMLHDTERNAKYYEAIRKAVASLRSRGKPVRVLDIGTGTGLLSLMAATCGADVITACEGFEPMAKCAERVIQQNGFADKIKVVAKRSTELTVGPGCDVEEPANLLVTEVFDTELIGEGALHTYEDALGRLVEPGCLAVPCCATVFAQVVQSDAVLRWNNLPQVPQVGIVPPASPSSCSGSSAVHDVQLTQLPQDMFVSITRPEPVFRFDFTGKEQLRFEEVACKTTLSQSEGRCDAVFMWWELQMDAEGEVTLSCAPQWAQPDKLPWRDHWMQAIYYLANPVAVGKDEPMTLVARHDAYSMQFCVTKDAKAQHCGGEVCTCGVHLAMSRTRLGMLNDPLRHSKYLAALNKASLAGKCALTISDGSLLPLISAKLGARKVYAIEPEPLCRQVALAYIRSNGIADRIEVIPKHPSEVTKADVPEEVDVVLGDPYFTTTLLPWDALFFWFARSSLDALLSPSALVLPRRAVIRGLAVQFRDLWKIKAPVGDVEGFDLSHFDRMIQAASQVSDASVEPHPLWEYPCVALGDPFDMLEFDLSKPVGDDPYIVGRTAPFLSSGTCNGVALWVDFCLDSELVVSTGPSQEVVAGEEVCWDMYSRQGVHLMDTPHAVDKADALSYAVTFAPKDGTFHFAFEIAQREKPVLCKENPLAVY